jgi:alkylhydroperoxidase family enzyme
MMVALLTQVEQASTDLPNRAVDVYLFERSLAQISMPLVERRNLENLYHIYTRTVCISSLTHSLTHSLTQRERERERERDLRSNAL